MTIYGILVAAGRGERFGGPKHMALLRGRPMWEWSRDALLSGGVDHVITVGDVPDGVPGGLRRRDSVANGLAAVPSEAMYVLVHDAARPLVPDTVVRSVIDRLTSGGCDAVVPAVPIRDTVKRVDGSMVVGTVDREHLVAVQTPQGFRVEALRAAHAGDHEEATDDAQLVERAGGTVAVVDGSPRNLKITYPGDLIVAEGLLT